MPNLNHIQSVFTLILIAALTGVVVGQSDKPERPKEADIESVSSDIEPSLRSTIAEKLRDEVDAVKKQLAERRASLKQLQEKLRDQEKDVRELDLKVQYLLDRLGQWSPEQVDAEKATEAGDDKNEKNEKDDESRPEATEEKKQEEVKP